MVNIRDALLRMVKAARMAREFDDILGEKGYSTNPYGDLYGLIFDAVYYLIGDKSETMADSQTHKILTAPFMEDERRASCLAYILDVNFTRPAPHVSEKDNFAEPRTGYKFRETPEGDWEERKVSDDLGTVAKAVKLSQALRECGNELCCKCGKYKEEHLGACDGCKWRYVKDGEMPG